MTLTSLGNVTVPTPGTPVFLSTDPTVRVCRVTIQTAPANTGKMYFGLTGMQKSTLAGVSRVLVTSSDYEIATQDGTNGIALFYLSIDADVANEGLLVSYWTE